MLVTLGNRHHLDGLVVIGELGDHPAKLVGDPTQVVSGMWVIHHDGVSKNQPVEST